MPDINGLMNQAGTLAIGITAVTIVLVIIITIAAFYFVRRMSGPNKALLEKGTPGQATIQRVWQTGAYINHQPQIGMSLLVQVPGQTPYETETKMVIPMVNIPQFQPGVTLPVKVDPANPRKIALDVYA